MPEQPPPEQNSAPDPVQNMPEVKIESAVPKARIQAPLEAKPKWSRPLLYSACAVFICGLSFFCSYLLIGAAVEKMRGTFMPVKTVSLDIPAGAMEAKEYLYNGIAKARREIVACLPVQYPINRQLFKMLGRRASDGVAVIVIMNEAEAAFAQSMQYLEYYGAGRVRTAAFPRRIYDSTFLLDGQYVIKCSVPPGSTLGTQPEYADLRIYKSKTAVDAEKRKLADIQKGAFSF